MDKVQEKQIEADLPVRETRRNFLGKSALLGLTGALGLAGCKEDGAA